MLHLLEIYSGNIVKQWSDAVSWFEFSYMLKT